MTERLDEVEVEHIEATWGPRTLVMGRYELEEKLGVGGMGEVWLATDTFVGLQVAIKFLVGSLDRDARRRFSAEVRAMARLDHPHIVGVLDQGDFDDAPLFVMNLVRGLPLGRWLRMSSWEKVGIAFDQVLDALSYAHARGVIHRDLKPSNIIVSGTPDHPHSVVLDLGIAIDPWSDGLVTGEIVGSPGYMAPEQRRGETWRARQGTDLFAFGILLYEAICGLSPFKRTPKDDFASPTFLVPRARFPLKPRQGFEDAAEQLEPLLKKLLSLPLSRRPLLAADVREQLARAVAQVRRSREDDWDEDADECEEDSYVDGTELLSPWHPVYLEPRAPTTRLPPGSYGLYGLRQAPVIGRDAELESLWRAARSAFACGQPHVTFLEGVAGIGKSHLATHLCERANERGLARFVEVSYLQNAPADSGIVAAIEQILRVRNAPLESTKARIDAWLEDEDELNESLGRALLGLLRAGGPGHVGHNAEIALFLRLLNVMCNRRAVVLLVRDVHLCADGTALPVLSELLEQSALPVLALATVRVDEKSPGFDEAYGALLERERVERLTLGPLPEQAVRSLLKTQMTLEKDLEDTIIKRSEGLPLLARQLLDELVKDNALEESTAGGRIKKGKILSSLPSEVHSLWKGRIERVAHKDESGAYWVDALQGLALARVALTPKVVEAAGHVSGEALDDAVEAWEREGLLMNNPGQGIRFCHSQFAEEVAAQVTADAATRWHVIWAAALQRLEGDEGGRFGVERGLHLALAGEKAKALAALLSGAEQAYFGGDAARCLVAATEAETIARDVRDRIRLGWALRWRGSGYLATGRVDHAETLLDRARELFKIERVLLGMGWALDGLGRVRISQADYLAAVEHCTLGAEAFRRAQDDVGLATILGTLGYGLARLGRYSEARAVVAEAEQVARSAGNERALAGALQGLAECARYQGELEEAAHWYEASMEIAQKHWRALIPPLSNGMGLTALAQGDIMEARKHLMSAWEQAHFEGQHRRETLYSADVAAAALMAGDIQQAKEHLELAEQGAAEIDRVDEHMQWALERVITASAMSCSPTLVMRAGNLAADLWERLGRDEDAQRVREELALAGAQTTPHDKSQKRCREGEQDGS